MRRQRAHLAIVDEPLAAARAARLPARLWIVRLAHVDAHVRRDVDLALDVHLLGGSGSTSGRGATPASS